MWDATTCVDTLVAVSPPARGLELPAELADRIKSQKYQDFDSDYLFTPYEVEYLSPWGPIALCLLKTNSKKFIYRLGDPWAGIFIAQA